MARTSLDIRGSKFHINGRPTYAELPGAQPEALGLLMNARFVQGVFDDAADPRRFARFGFADWDPEANTARLAAALPEWREYGLRAFTVGFQGGGPCFTTANATIDNNPFGSDGRRLDRRYAERMDSLLRGADEAGMAVIVSYFYGAQARRIEDGVGIRNAVTAASRFLKDGGYTNVIIEVANEMNIDAFAGHPIIREPEGMAWLIDLARVESGGLPVGCSGGGGYRNRQVVDASDVVLIHGNGLTRQRYYAMVREVRGWAPDKPVVCNEDSAALGQLAVAERTATSWGYYNNMTKQEPPARWGVLPGEDRFFALRTAELIGIERPQPEFEEQYFLQGFEPEMTVDGTRWPRLASLYPESVHSVDFYRDGALFYTSYDEPFTVNFLSTWEQRGVDVSPGESWKAVVRLRDGRVLEKEARCL